MDNKKFTIKKIIPYIAVFVLSVLIYVVAIIVQGSYPFGEKSFLTYDAYVQYKNMFHTVFSWMAGDRSTCFLWDTGLGVDIYQEMTYYLFSPFNIIVFAMGEAHIELSMVVLIVVKASCIPVTALYFFRHTRYMLSQNNQMLKMNGSLQILLTQMVFAMSFGLSGYVLAYGNNMMWIDDIIVMPLIAIGIERISEKKGFKLYVISLALAMLVNFYFSFYICMFSLIYFLLLDRENLRTFVKRFAVFALCSILSAVIAAVVMIPAALVIVNGDSSVSAVGAEYLSAWGQVGEYISSFFPLKEVSCNYFFTNNSYCGSIALLLVMVFMCSKVASLKNKCKNLLAMIILVLALNYIPLNYVFHGMVLPHGMGNRFAFILTFIILVAGYRTLMNWDRVKMPSLIISIILTLALFVVSLLDQEDMSNPYGYIIFMLVVCFVSLMAVFEKKGSVTVKAFVCIILGLWIAELAGNSVLVLKDKTEDVLLDEETQIDVWSDDYDSLSVDVGERKTALVAENLPGYSNFNWYSSMSNGYAIRSLKSLGIGHFDNVEYVYYGTTPLTALMYNVRYVMTQEKGIYAGYHEISEATENIGAVDNTGAAENTGSAENTGVEENTESAEKSETDRIYTLYEADDLLGMGFVVNDSIENWNTTGDALENQNDFVKQATGITEDMFTPFDMSELTPAYLNMEVVREAAGSCTYRTINPFSPMVRYEFDADEDMDLYLYSYDSRNQYVEVLVDGELTADAGYYLTEYVSHIGEVKKGQHVKITVGGQTSSKNGMVGEKIMQLYTFNSQVFEQAKEVLSESVLTSKGIVKGNFTASVDVAKEGVLYIAYPYNPGFQVYVDGEKTDKLCLGSGNLGVKVSEGQHEIVIEYHTPGLLPGIIVSLMGLAIFAVIIGMNKKYLNYR